MAEKARRIASWKGTGFDLPQCSVDRAREYEIGKISEVLVPRYFFTIRGREPFKEDPYGANLPDIAAALSNAERKIRELRKESGYNNDPSLMMIVEDVAGHTVLSLPFFPGY
jgi:hypothetical protein